MADTVIHNAKVYLGQGHFAEAVLVRGDRIAKVGSNKEILSKTAPAVSADSQSNPFQTLLLLKRPPPGIEIIDAGGNLLVPGFNDSHIHLHDFGRYVHRIQARGVTSIDELVERGRALIDRLKPPQGSVITGTGWDQDRFIGEQGLPNRHDMDRISTDHAVIISRVCGHSLCGNSLAMEMAGLTRGSPFVAGEQVDAHGDPLGIFGEGEAARRLRAIIPPCNREQAEENLLYAMRHALANGLTSVGTMDVVETNYLNIVGAYIKMLSEHDLHVRVNLQCAIEQEAVFDAFIRRGWITGASMGHPYLTMGASKLFADGSLGARTAYMRKPYADAPSTRGYQIHPQEEMDALVRKNHANGFQVIAHAIGDAAIEEALNSFEKAAGGRDNDLRHGIVHCQITDMPLLQRMAHNGILAFMQPIFVAHDLYMIENRVGPALAATSCAHAAMNRLGIRVSYGTDCPIESMSPIECIDCAVNRTDALNGYPAEGFYPGECVSVYTAVDAYTIGSAYAEFAEDRKGRIKEGYLADMTLLDRDIFTIPKKEIRMAQILWTMVGGKMAYRLGFECF